MTAKGKSSGLTLDWQGGFSLYNTETREYHWKYKFSQLKGSSDDGKTKLKLHFQDENKHIETKVNSRQISSSMESVYILYESDLMYEIFCFCMKEFFCCMKIIYYYIN